MQCRRCHGLMVIDHFIDIENTGHLWLCGWRCVSCGDVVDPEIIEHRRVQQSRLGRLAQTLRSRAHKTRDVVKLSA